MNWQCPECGNMNDDSISRCACGYELDIPVTTSTDQADGMNSQLPGYPDSDVLLHPPASLANGKSLTSFRVYVLLVLI